MSKHSENSISLNKKPKATKTVLAIETGIAAGSVSLLVNNEEIDFWVGEGRVSKSEDILDAIKNVLAENAIKIEAITLLAFSNGPGSFTGLRIGAAIVKGLSKAFDCAVKSESVLEAMAGNVSGNNILAAAVPIGKTQVCWQLFETGANGSIKVLRDEPYIADAESFLANYQKTDADTWILQKSLYEKFTAAEKRISINNKNFINAGDNLAKYIGKKAQEEKNENSPRFASLNYIETHK